MPRHLIREASSGRTRVVGSGALPFFPGWVVLDTLDDNQPANSFYDAAASDFRYVNVTELGDPASPAREVLDGIYGGAPTTDAAKENYVPARLADVALKAALETRVDRTGATTGEVPVLQPDGTLAFDAITAGVASVNGASGAVVLDAGDVGAVPEGDLRAFGIYMPHNYGAVGDGVADDGAELQAMFSAIPTAGGKVYFPAKNYLVPNGGLTCSNPVHIIGTPGLDGTGSRITVTADAVTGLTLSGSASTVEHLNIRHPLGGGRSSTLIGLVMSNANFSRMDNVRVEGFYTNAKVTTGIYYSILNSNFRDFVGVGLNYLNGLAGGDAGDGTIQNCTFDRGSDTVAGGTAVLWQSGGGMRFVNNKINGRPSGGAFFQHGLRLVPDAGASTGVIIVADNSIENFTGVGVSLTLGSSTFFNTVVIGTNEISGLSGAAGSTAILLDNGPSGIAITGNHIYSVDVGIDLNRIKHAAISGNPLTTITSTGIRVREFCKDVVIGRQPIDVIAGGADVVFDKPWAIADPSYEKTIPFGGNNGSDMPPITDGAVHNLVQIASAPYTNLIVDIDVTGTAQGNGSWVARLSRMVAGNGAGQDLSVATIGTDYAFQASSAVVVVTSTGLGGSVRFGVQKVGGTDLSGHMTIKVRGTGLSSFKQLDRYN